MPTDSGACTHANYSAGGTRGMGAGRIGARLAAEPGRAVSSRGGVGTEKGALPPSVRRGEAARNGEPIRGELLRPPRGPPNAPRLLASKELAPPNGAPPATPAAGTPNAPAPSPTLLPGRTRATLILFSAPDGAAFSAPPPILASADTCTPSATRRRMVGARMEGVGRRGTDPAVPNSAFSPSSLFCVRARVVRVYVRNSSGHSSYGTIR